jgi:Resolvase, N terminal domain/Recombinase
LNVCWQRSARGEPGRCSRSKLRAWLATGEDWHTLIEFCGLVGAIIVDEDGVYDPRHPNDRLLLGMKGTMSELELSILRQRSLEALKQKARRGELFLTVAIGYMKVGHNRIDKDPDQRVCAAVALVFAKFTELQSIRQVHLWFRQECIDLPAVSHTVEGGRSIVWKLPVYNTIHHILTNPIYAGAYAFGRTGSRVTIEAGRPRGGKLSPGAIGLKLPTPTKMP